jgi:Flp pilus assembly pilin Flp
MKFTIQQGFLLAKSHVQQLVEKLWEDDCGAVLSVEYVLISGVLVTGVVPGLVAARNSINSAYANMGNSVIAAVPQPNFSGFSIGGGNGNAIASVGGMSVAPPPSANYLHASQIAPLTIPSP